MSLEDNSLIRGGVKTLAIRLEPDRHAQLTMIAQLRGNTITDELRQAVEGHIDAIKATPEFASKAETVLAEIEREAAARREAIGALFGSPPPDGGSRTRSRKPAGDSTTDG